ncbi:malate synthase A [Sciscionella marina]|uniref:malate synthase A n=1 Tax=Sciscionella marina TaxID=508770 RepID=UPI0004779633|nr:malate synthase A [Sciscionella marina]
MSDVRVLGAEVEATEEIRSPEALRFLAELHEAFAGTRAELLAARARRRAQVAETGRLDWLEETRTIREGQWQVAPAPPALHDRRVEITGPTDRKMTVNALNSQAKVWLADLEDSNTPHWANVLGGQRNLYDAVRGQITYDSPEGKHYALHEGQQRPAIVVRPRGWHLDERNIEIGGRPAIGALVDFGLYFFHNAAYLLEHGSGPYFYLPKMESHLEARLWAEVFAHAEAALGIPRGSVRATVLIETIPAAFEMDEILYELREYASGLNAGRWDYLFSVIKYFRDAGERFVLPDRDGVTMTAPFMRAYTELLVRTCHRRGAYAIGGMAAFIPNRRDPQVTERALAKVHEDKRREAAAGFDGSWVAHPDLVAICAEEFGAVLGDRPNQLDRLREDVEVTADELLDVAATPGQATERGVRSAVDVGVRYIASWLGGNGAAAIHNLMEDAATAEISRSQLWQWIHNGTRLDTGAVLTAELVREILAETGAELAGEIPADRLETAVEIFGEVALAEEFADFLTLPAYQRIS